MCQKHTWIIISLMLVFASTAQAQSTSDPLVAKGTVFGEIDGLVAVEAEYFYQQTMTDNRQWYLTAQGQYANVGRDADIPHLVGASNHAYVEILPDTRVTHGDKLIAGENFSGEPGKLAVLHYQVHISQPGRYYVWVRAFSTGSEDNGLHVGLDGTWPASGQRMQWCQGKHTWRWESKQRTKENHCGEPHQIYLDIDEPGVHDLMFSMREDGFEFDRFFLTTDQEYERPEGKGPTVNVKAGPLPPTFPEVTENPQRKLLFIDQLLQAGAASGIKIQSASAFDLEGSDFYVHNRWLAVNPNKHKEATAQTRFGYKAGAYDVILMAVGENDGQSSYALSLNGGSIGTYTVPLSKKTFEEGAAYCGLFENVSLKKGDKLAVLGRIGSADGKEYSRGRFAGVAFVEAGKGAALLKQLIE